MGEQPYVGTTALSVWCQTCGSWRHVTPCGRADCPFESPPVRHHQAMAADVWRMIKALSSTEFGTPMALKDLEKLDGAATTLIEMACDSAAESQRVALGYPPKGAR